jgi:hypothetical protein
MTTSRIGGETPHTGPGYGGKDPGSTPQRSGPGYSRDVDAGARPSGLPKIVERPAQRAPRSSTRRGR